MIIKKGAKTLHIETMFLGFSCIFFQKNVKSGGAAGHQKFHAGAWLHQAPAFGGACFRGRKLSHMHTLASTGHRWVPFKRDTNQNMGGGSFSRSWLYCRVSRKGHQIFVSHFFLIHISYSDHKSKESCSKYQFKKQPPHFPCLKGSQSQLSTSFQARQAAKQSNSRGCFLD